MTQLKKVLYPFLRTLTAAGAFGLFLLAAHSYAQTSPDAVAEA